MSTEIHEIIGSIQDSCRAKIKLNLPGGLQRSIDCIFKEDVPPNFYLVFPPDTLPVEIDKEKIHPVSVSYQDKTLSVNSYIVEVTDQRRLYLQAKATVDPASLREYFRVNSSIEITISYFPSRNPESSHGWTIHGMTQDLSASGVLALFPDEPKNNTDIIIEILLPNKRVSMVGHIVRKKKLRNRRSLVSFHFDTISAKDRDSILTFLFSEQRKQLRDNVNVFR